MAEWKFTALVLVTLTLEAAGALVWAGAAGERLAEVEMRVAAQSQAVERLIHVEVQLDVLDQRLARIEKALTRP
jgi:hypothetical protein